MSLQTRGSSTLVIVTFLASASLLLLTVPFKSNGSELKLFDLAIIGFTFASLGVGYREATVLGIDRWEHNRDPETIKKRKFGFDHPKQGFVREFILLWFLFIPVMLWLLVLLNNGQFFVVWFTMLIASVPAGVLALIDYCLRMQDRCKTGFVTD